MWDGDRIKAAALLCRSRLSNQDIRVRGYMVKWDANKEGERGKERTRHTCVS